MSWSKATNILDGVNALGSLLDTTNTTLNGEVTKTAAILAAINSTEYGLAAIKKAIGEESPEAAINAIKAAVEDSQHGLAAIRALIAPVD